MGDTEATAAEAPERIPFTEESVKSFLDDGIRHWQSYGKQALQLGFQANAARASHYVDVLQVVRKALFGGVLS